MAKEPELMIAAWSFGSDNPYPIEVKQGLQLLSDHPIVTRHPHAFVRVADGAEALGAARRKRDAANERKREQDRLDLRAARIAMGTKFDASDDAIVETAKRRARSDDTVELVHDANGYVVGVRTKPAIIEAARQRAEKAALAGESEVAQRVAELQRAREA